MINDKVKIERKSFFKLAGIAVLGMGISSIIPFKFLQTSKEKNPSIKITQNPNAVRRNSRQENNG